MSNVQTLPKFNISDAVCYLSDPIEDTFDGAAPSGSCDVLQSQVIARFHANGLGWIYRVAGVRGLIEESLLRSFDPEAEELPGDQMLPAGIYEGVDSDEVRKFLNEAQFAPGQFVLVTDVASQLTDGSVEPLYGLITGMGYLAGDLCYDVAVMHANGSFITEEFPLDEDQMERVDDEVVQHVIARRQQAVQPTRPTLTVVHSR